MHEAIIIFVILAIVAIVSAVVVHLKRSNKSENTPSPWDIQIPEEHSIVLPEETSVSTPDVTETDAGEEPESADTVSTESDTAGTPAVDITKVALYTSANRILRDFVGGKLDLSNTLVFADKVVRFTINLAKAGASEDQIRPWTTLVTQIQTAGKKAAANAKRIKTRKFNAEHRVTGKKIVKPTVKK